MEKSFAKKLCTLNNEFYRAHAASFSATRTSPWNGWHVCATELCALPEDTCRATPSGGVLQDSGTRLNAILDLACGNLRFEAFLHEKLAPRAFDFLAVDDCAGLIDAHHSDARAGEKITFQELDIVDALIENEALEDLIGCAAAGFDAKTCFDASVCFGFMHHLPTQEMRAALLNALIGKTRTGGLVMISFWEFLNNEGLAAKAEVTHAAALADLHLTDGEQAQLDEHDFFLGWKDTQHSYRYCHSFNGDEIDELLALPSIASRTEVVRRFHADGRSDNLNEYLMLRVV